MSKKTKTARERAAEIYLMIDEYGGADPNRGIAEIERHLREYGRDQRHLCAEAVNNLADGYADGEDADPGLLADRAHSLAMNAPEPGRQP